MAKNDDLNELKKAVGLDDKSPTLKDIRASDDPDKRGERIDDEDA